MPQQEVIDTVAADKISFGSAVALSGNLMLVSDCDWANAQGLERGRVHAYSRPDAGQPFSLDHRFSAPNNGPLGFGTELLLAGTDAIISAPNITFQSFDPNLYVLRYQPGSKTWTPSQELLPLVSNLPTAFGASGMDTSQGLLAVGDTVTKGPGGLTSGVCHLYQLDAGTGLWSNEAMLTPPFPADGMRFGRPAVISSSSVAIVAEQVADIPTGSLSSRVYIYTKDVVGIWGLTQVLRADDFAPASTHAFDSIEVDQDLMVIGQSEYDLPNGASQGRAVVYRLNNMGDWLPETTLESGAAGTAGDRLGASLDLLDGHVMICAPGADNGFLNQGAALALDLSPSDCNGNLIPDACDLVSGVALDRNHDRIPDSCQMLGTPICEPAVVNSTGNPGELYGLSLGSLDPDMLQVCGSSLPPGEFGYLLGSSGQDLIFSPGGSVGNLCLASGSNFGRFVTQIQQFSAAGIACTLVDFRAVPTGLGTVALTSGDIWYFQLWHRDGNTSNFTPGLEITIP